MTDLRRLTLADPIVHQRQPTTSACTQTCLAMAVGVEVEQLGIPLDRGTNFENMGLWLAERGVWLHQLPHGWPLHQGKLYLLSVPSLNYLAGHHAILFDCRALERQDHRVFDPMMGFDRKSHYHWIHADECLETWILVDHTTGRRDSRYAVREPAPASVTELE